MDQTSFESVQETPVVASLDTFNYLVIKSGTSKEILNVLQHQSFSCTSSDEDGNSVLHLVIKNGKLTEEEKVKIAELFLSKGVDPNAKNIYQETPLHCAVLERLKGVIDVLVRHRAHINKRNRDGNSIAHYFVKDEFRKFRQKFSSLKINNENLLIWDDENMDNETADFVEYLVDKGFDFDIKNTSGHSALDLAIDNNLLHILPAMLKKTYDIKYLPDDYKKVFSLFMPKTFPPKPFYERYVPNIVKILLCRRAPVTIESEDDIQFINEMVNEFPKSFDGINCATSWFYAIMRSCGFWDSLKTNSYLKILAGLIDRGADFIYQNELNNYTPLYWAVKGTNINAVEFLKDKGVNFRVETKKSQNLLHEIAKDDGSKRNGVFFLNKQMQIVKILLSEGLNVNSLDKNKKSPLYFVLLNKRSRFHVTEVIEEFLKWGADINEDCILDMLPQLQGIFPIFTLIRHWIKLRIAELPCSDEYEKYLHVIEHEVEEFQLACLKEIEVLKNTFFCDQVSMYDFLHMNTKKRCIYLKNERLLSIVNSPVIEETFPKYSFLILAKFRQSVAWKAMLEPAKIAWEELTGIYLPDICIERVLVYLNNTDLVNITREIEYLQD